MHSKGNYKQGEKTALRMRENNSKWNNWQRINFQNIQAAHTTLYQKNNPIKNWEKYLNRHFSKDIPMANKQVKRCSTSIIIRELQIKTAMKYHLTPVRMTIIKKSKNSKYWKKCGEKRIILQCWWECKLIQAAWGTVWRFLKKLEKKNCYTTQQSHWWADTLSKPEFKETHVPQFSLQCCLQQLDMETT